MGESVVDGVTYAVEWNGGGIINLGPGVAYGINDVGQVVGQRPVPESSTWAMTLLGFAGLAFAGYRRAKAGPATLARSIHGRNEPPAGLRR